MFKTFVVMQKFFFTHIRKLCYNEQSFKERGYKLMKENLKKLARYYKPYLGTFILDMILASGDVIIIYLIMDMS